MIAYWLSSKEPRPQSSMIFFHLMQILSLKTLLKKFLFCEKVKLPDFVKNGWPFSHKFHFRVITAFQKYSLLHTPESSFKEKSSSIFSAETSNTALITITNMEMSEKRESLWCKCQISTGSSRNRFDGASSFENSPSFSELSR